LNGPFEKRKRKMAGNKRERENERSNDPGNMKKPRGSLMR
jgi:hypothetical protein